MYQWARRYPFRIGRKDLQKKTAALIRGRESSRSGYDSTVRKTGRFQKGIWKGVSTTGTKQWVPTSYLGIYLESRSKTTKLTNKMGGEGGAVAQKGIRW